MLVFVDESGDPGRRVSKGSSLYFVVAVVAFADHDDANACDQRIGLLRRGLGLNDGFEFHFAQNSKNIRHSFLSAVAEYPFFYHVFAVDKGPKDLYSMRFTNSECLYNWCISNTFEIAWPDLDNATVVIDKSGGKDFRNRLATHLRQRGPGNPRIKKVKVQRSSGNNLLQLADYVASVSNRVLQERPEGIELRSLYLESHEQSFRVRQQ